MGSLLNAIHRPAFAEVGAHRLRIPSRLLDIFWICLAIYVIPDLLFLCLFGHSAEFFRGWLNTELAIAFAAVLVFRSSRLPLLLLAVELIADLVEPIAHVFYFNSSDAIEALRYLEVLPAMRLFIYAAGVTAYLCVTLFALMFLARRITNRIFSSSLITVLTLVACVMEVSTGRYATLSHMDARSSRTLLIRTPLASIASRSWSKGQGPKSQQIDSCFRHLSPEQRSAIIGGRMNVVSVLVESWGLFNDPILRSSLAAPLTTPEIAARYRIDMGTVLFVGSTIFGGSRNLCSEIFNRPLEKVSADRLAQCYPAQFARSGYSTIAIHGFYPHMYGRDRWLPEVGFKQALFEPELKKMGMHTCRGGLVGTCDSDVADLIHKQLLDHGSPEPKFIHWTTLDSNLPIDVTRETVQRSNCAAAPQISDDDPVCVWYSLVHRVNAKVAQIALDKSLPHTVFLLVGDHAPPFFGAARRGRFSQDRVPYVILVPRT